MSADLRDTHSRDTDLRDTDLPDTDPGNIDRGRNRTIDHGPGPANTEASSSRWLSWLATLALVAVGTMWPNQEDSGVAEPNAKFIISASSPQDAVNNVLQQIARREWHSAYELLGNKGEFSETEFRSDLTGDYGSLRSYAMLESV